jgi:signal transduction histidine kinase
LQARILHDDSHCHGRIIRDGGPAIARPVWKPKFSERKNLNLKLVVHSNPTVRIEELKYLQNCINDLLRVQAALQGLGRLMENGPMTAEPKRAESALQKLQSELAHVARLTTMGELAASIAHEINQPLGAIVNNGNLCLRLLASRPTEHPEMRDAISDIVEDANRANAIVARVRAMTKRTASEKTALQLEGIISDVIVLARHELDKYSIEVHTLLSDNLPRVLGDRVQLQQVFLNLVINSIEAMAGIAAVRRILTISGKRGDLKTGHAALVTVHDNGVGFPREAEDRIFEAFYTTKPQGMGMGLRISRSIVEAHGGLLWAKSALGEGTTLFCLLPTIPPKEP